MFKYVISILFLMLVGCSDERAVGCAGFGCWYDNMSEEYQITSRSDVLPELTPDLSKMDVFYHSTATCVGVWYEPNIHVVITDKLYGDYYGLTYVSDNITTIVIRGILNHDSQESTIKHEFVHYLLWKSTGDVDLHHVSPLFGQCSGHQGRTL